MIMNDEQELCWRSGFDFNLERLRRTTEVPKTEYLLGEMKILDLQNMGYWRLQ
jgi:hypothetical protein